MVLVLLIVFMATCGVLFSSGKQAPSLERQAATHQALLEAKQALIGWSAFEASNPGQLPCPEDTLLIGAPNEGSAQSNCNAAFLLGRLPWKTLKLPQLRDETGEPLWYATSLGFRTPPINSDTPPQLAVDGIVQNAVAVIIAPLAPIASQLRSSPSAAAPLDPAQYLELVNKDGNGQFVSTGLPISFNDRLIVITQKELFAAVEKRVAGDVLVELANFFAANQYFPRPAAFNDASCLGTGNVTGGCNSSVSANAGRIPANPVDGWPTLLLRGATTSNPKWFQVNGWRELISYATANACTDGTTNCNGSGFLTVLRPGSSSLTSQKVVVTATGSALAPGQSRTLSSSKMVLNNYLEDENATPNDNIFTLYPATPGTIFNDQLLTLP